MAGLALVDEELFDYIFGRMKTYSEARTSVEFRAFQSTPGISVAVLPNSPDFTILAATNDFVSLTRPRHELLGESYFTLPLAGQCDASFAGVETLKDSFAFVIQHKTPHEIKSLAGGIHETRYWDIKNTPVEDESGSLLYIIHTIVEVTDKFPTKEQNASILEVEKAYRFFMQAPVVLGFVRGENYEIELASDDLLRVWKVNADVLGKRLFDVFPELEKQGFRDLLDQVRHTGKPFGAYEYPITFDRFDHQETYYFDFVYQPFFEGNETIATGVMAVGHDVTAQVIAKKQSAASQQKWKDLANSMPVIVWTAKPDGALDFINERWSELTGLDQVQSLEFGWTAALHPEDYKLCLDSWNTAIQNATLYELEARWRKKHGELVWLIWRVMPNKQNGTVVAGYATPTNIEKNTRLESDLEEKVRAGIQEVYEKNKLLDSILTHSSNGISVSKLIFDDAGNIVDAQTILANDAAVKYIGLQKDLYLSKPATYFDPHVIQSEYGQACIRTHQTGEPFIMRYFLDFSQKWLELTVSRMDDMHLIHIFTDVTPMKEAQSKLEKSLHDLQVLNANLEAFAYAASHDLKEPIRKHQFYTNKLKEELKHMLEPRYISLIEKLEAISMRMSKLVDDLLEYSQASKGAVDHQEIRLEQIIRSVQEDLELEIQKRQAVITVQTLPVMTGNSRQIHQLFQNLISNALKYSKHGSVPEIIIRSTSIAGKDVTYSLPLDAQNKLFNLIEVQDNGIGFDQEDAERMFDVFTRLHSDAEYRGSGIGLSIVKRVVEGHNGYIWAKGVPDAGSVFYILLPV